MRTALVAAAALAAAAPAGAQMLPPQDARPLSEIVASVEAMDEVATVLEIDWDDDGYWDVEFVDPDNRSGKLRIDAVTGEELPRRRR
jgi:uncharacterized membrane protein YkoI